tara:strand:- start:24336 stop:24635 length:300 start_codon:yes stop_codon:yes gene_type:complete
MNIRFTARHFDASTSLKNYSEDAVTKLEQFYDRIVSCSIVLEPTADNDNPQKAEIIIQIPNKVLTASESAPKYEQAVLATVENLSRQLKRYKEKKYTTY